MQGWYDVTDYGAIGNGGSDDSGAIQSAMEDAGANGGGVIWFPPGTYRLDAGLVIAHPVTLLGAGWQVPTGNGSWFYGEDTSITPVYVAPGGAGAAIRDLAVRHNQPSARPGWTPLNYPFAFSVAATDVHLQNIFLLNATQGINIDNPGGSIGRVVLDRIWGQPMRVGILVRERLEPSQREKFQASIEMKVAWFGSTISEIRYVADSVEAVHDAVKDLLRGSDLLLTAGANATDPLDPTLVALGSLGARMEKQGAPAHPGSAVWLAYLEDKPIFGVAACGMFSKATVLDLILPRLFTVNRVTAADFNGLGHGGLLSKDMAFRFPPYGAFDTLDAD